MRKADDKHISTIYCVANGDKYFGGKKKNRQRRETVTNRMAGI